MAQFERVRNGITVTIAKMVIREVVPTNFLMGLVGNVTALETCLFVVMVSILGAPTLKFGISRKLETSGNVLVPYAKDEFPDLK